MNTATQRTAVGPPDKISAAFIGVARALREVAMLLLLLAADAAAQPRQGWGPGEMPGDSNATGATRTLGLAPDAPLLNALAQPGSRPAGGQPAPMSITAAGDGGVSPKYWDPMCNYAPGDPPPTFYGDAWAIWPQSNYYRGYRCQVGKAQLLMRDNGDLVVYDEFSRPRWRSGTAGSGHVAVFQHDGNYVIYNSAGTPIWHSNTWGNPGAVLVVQADGNVVIYRSDGYPLWATNTAP